MSVSYNSDEAQDYWANLDRQAQAASVLALLEWVLPLYGYSAQQTQDVVATYGRALRFAPVGEKRSSAQSDSAKKKIATILKRNTNLALSWRVLTEKRSQRSEKSPILSDTALYGMIKKEHKLPIKIPAIREAVMAGEAELIRREKAVGALAERTSLAA